MAQDPITIMVAPFSVYIGPVGETYPDVDDTPAGNWVLLGTNGDKSMDESGVTITLNQTVDLHRVYGATAPIKATRSSEDVVVAFTLLDLSSAEYTRILNHNTVTDTAEGATTGGYHEINLYQGLDVTQRAWLFKGLACSPHL